MSEKTIKFCVQCKKEIQGYYFKQLIKGDLYICEPCHFDNEAKRKMERDEEKLWLKLPKVN